MSKFYGAIGFAEETEPRPGVTKELIKEHLYVGETLRNTRRLETGNQVNDDLNVSNKISIIADPYANENFYKIRYAHFNGANWKVKSVEVQFPRLILELGGVWNGTKVETSDDSGRNHEE